MLILIINKEIIKGDDYLGTNNYIVAIIGFSGSGKDSVARVLEKKYGYKFVVSTTSRPMRSGESDGVQYHFITSEEFQKLKDDNQLIEYRYYDTYENGKPSRWHYGITKDEIDLEKCNHVAVVDLPGLQDLIRNFGSRVISVFLDVSEPERKLRAMARDKNFEEIEWQRRNKDDERVFENIYLKVDFVVNNYDFGKCINAVIDNIEQKKRQIKFFNQYSSY